MCSEASPRLRPHIARFTGGHQPRSLTQHAEIAALNLLPEGITPRQLRHTSLVVIRPKYSQKLRRTRMLCAKPCRECAQIIHQLGIKLVVYSSEDTLHRRTPEELLTDSVPSSGTEWLTRR
uniref:CMP/dCMP-type deaminase domain-containing protein n=1 Tax=Zooxanthella nutricula TaxID=1333877 RepID=A0A6U6H571_9DINO|mmetsp:Transcript_11772/g.34988  ORF Transcript_11772/g.34988 Transcript_11772/m.34988 type:complete len:121 (+) Transcript_11772:292-654(+)